MSISTVTCIVSYLKMHVLELQSQSSLGSGSGLSCAVSAARVLQVPQTECLSSALTTKFSNLEKLLRREGSF